MFICDISVSYTHLDVYKRQIQNLNEVGDRGSIVVKAGEKGPYYIMHIKTANVKALEYSDEAYEAGEFNALYLSLIHI